MFTAVALILGAGLITAVAATGWEQPWKWIKTRVGAGPLSFDPWHKVARKVPTYTTSVSQSYGADWDVLIRSLQLARVTKPTPRWVLTIYNENGRNLREWDIPRELDETQAQRAAEKLISNWGISDANIDLEVGMSLETVNGFSWIHLKTVVAAMWRHPLTRANGILVLNNMYFGRGTEIDWAMSLIQQAEAGNNVAMLDIKAIRYAADKGDKTKKNQLELLRVVRGARQMADQMAITEAALQPSEVIEQSPYSMLTQ